MAHIIKYENGGNPYFLQKSKLKRGKFDTTLLKESASKFATEEQAKDYILKVIKHITFKKFDYFQFLIIKL